MALFCRQCRIDFQARGPGGEYTACPRCGTVVRAGPPRRPARRAWAAAGVAAVLAAGAVALLASGGGKGGEAAGEPERPPSAPAGPGYVGAFRLPGGPV